MVHVLAEIHCTSVYDATHTVALERFYFLDHQIDLASVGGRRSFLRRRQPRGWRVANRDVFVKEHCPTKTLWAYVLENSSYDGALWKCDSLWRGVGRRAEPLGQSECYPYPHPGREQS